LSFRSSIIDVLMSLGLHLPFDPSKSELYVDDVIHKAVIEVNEEGSEAAAYSEYAEDLTGDEPRPSPPKPVDFVADHPFAFFIIEEMTGTIVFSGHVLDPSKEE
jgi:serpin B